MVKSILTSLKTREFQILILVLLLAAFLRLYRISDYMTFLGDEGRDVLIVKHILEGELTFLGPRSSAADFFYGPIYYYLIAPFLLLFRFDPVGPAVFIGLLGVLTVYLVYKFGRVFFGSIAGLTGAALYAVSPVIITYSHSSWNPNPLPFVSVLTLYTVYHALKIPKWWKFGLVGFLLGVALQLQYIALFLAIIIGVYTFVGTYIQQKTKRLINVFKRYTLIILGFVVGLSPFLVFEVRHGFPNTITIINFILGKYASPDEKKMTFFGQITEAFFKLFGRLITRYPETTSVHSNEKPDLLMWYVATMVLGLIVSLLVITMKDRLVRLLFGSWLLFGVGLFGFYRREIYDYYLGFLFPLPFFLIGYALSIPWKNNYHVFLKTLVSFMFLGLFLLNFSGMPFRYPPNRQKLQAETIANFVLQQANGKPFNFALITPGNSDHAYRYFLELKGNPPVTIQNSVIDPERKTVTDQLFVVCEDLGCQPLGNPLFEVAAFGRAEIAGEWNVSVVKVYKLVHYKG